MKKNLFNKNYPTTFTKRAITFDRSALFTPGYFYHDTDYLYFTTLPNLMRSIPTFLILWQVEVESFPNFGRFPGSFRDVMTPRKTRFRRTTPSTPLGVQKGLLT